VRAVPVSSPDSHGFPRDERAVLGGEIGFCEAVVFKFDGERFAGIEVKRLPKVS